MLVAIYTRQRAGWNTLDQAVRSRIIEDLRKHLTNKVESMGKNNIKPRSTKSVVPAHAHTESKYRLAQTSLLKDRG